jgi:hypothetical protein
MTADQLIANCRQNPTGTSETGTSDKIPESVML